MTNFNKTDLTILLPAYNEENNLEKCVSETVTTINSLNYSYEIIVIENGSKDYLRVPAVTVNKDFINSLKSSILKASEGDQFTSSIKCPDKYKKCPRLQNI